MFEFGTFVDTEMLPSLFRIAFIYGWTTFFSLTKLVPSLNVFKRVLTGIRPFPFDETFIIQNFIFQVSFVFIFEGRDFVVLKCKFLHFLKGGFLNLNSFGYFLQ